MQREWVLPWALLLAAVAAFSCAAEKGKGAPDLSSGDTTKLDSHAEELVASPPFFDWCQPDQPPDDACHALRRDPASDNIELARQIAQAQMVRHPAESLAWNWEEAVLLIAMAELYAVTGETALLDYIQEYVDHHIETGYNIGTSDSCVPTALAAELYRHTGDAGYKAVVQDALSYLYNEARRTEEGGISHLGKVDLVTLWLDSLFMFGNVLIRWAEYQADDEALNEFGKQFSIFSDLMQDKSGFYVHAHDWIVEQTPNTYWARGNGWVAAAGAMYVRVRTNRGESDEGADIALGKLLEAVMSSQDADSGLWWSVVNKPGEIYVETSGSALFAFGLARAWRYGQVGDDALVTLALAMEGIKGAVVPGDDGLPVVTGISGPTNADKYEQYALVLLEDDLPFGVGAVILALVETSGIELQGGDR